MVSLGLPARIDIREVGMRDGLQLEAPVPLADKLVLLDAIIALGVHRIEVTSFVSAKAVPALADADEVAAELGRWPGVQFSALVANTRGAVRAIEAGIANLEYVVSAAESHSLANSRRTSADPAAVVGDIAALAHGAGGTLEVIIATAWDCPFDGRTDPGRTLDVVAAAVRQGADELCLGDTIGTVTPARTVALLTAVREAARGVEGGVHFHDTRGTGQANVLSAILAGVRKLDASVAGLGGCPFAPGASGNIVTRLLDGGIRHIRRRRSRRPCQRRAGRRRSGTPLPAELALACGGICSAGTVSNMSAGHAECRAMPLSPAK
jgi:hydroxymethylglutaryl-CoA lyase